MHDVVLHDLRERRVIAQRLAAAMWVCADASCFSRRFVYGDGDEPLASPARHSRPRPGARVATPAARAKAPAAERPASPPPAPRPVARPATQPAPLRLKLKAPPPAVLLLLPVLLAAWFAASLDWSWLSSRSSHDSAPAPAASAELLALRRRVAALEARLDALPPPPPPAPSAAAVSALVTSAVDRLHADRTGLPDYASATAGGRVLAHSPLVSWAVPDAAASASHLHPRADELLLTAAFETPGHCLPLAGGGAWVDVALREAVHVTAVSLEHVGAAIAFDAASAPRRFELHALRDGGGEGALLVAGSYEAPMAGGEAASPVQTFAAGPGAAAAPVSRVRLALRSNHGGDYTCLYRLRVHGTPAGDTAATHHHAQS